MTSAQIQIELIISCGNVIIVSSIHKAGIYSLIADETTDVAKNEQLALGISYVDDKKNEVHNS